MDFAEITRQGHKLVEIYGREVVIKAENKAAAAATLSYRPMSQYWIEAFVRNRKLFAKEIFENDHQ